MPNDEDLLYEEELLRNPYSLKMWTRYIEARKGIAAKRRYILYERAVKALPGSYKVTVRVDIQIGQQHMHDENASCSMLAWKSPPPACATYTLHRAAGPSILCGIHSLCSCGMRTSRSAAWLPGAHTLRMLSCSS